MTEQEALDKDFKRLISRKYWNYSDSKKFGWGKSRKNRKTHPVGNIEYRKYRKNMRKQLRYIRHCILMHIPVSKEDVSFLKLYERIYLH